MSYRLVIRPEAKAELMEAYHWYEDRSKGLGEEFLRCVISRLTFIQRNPKLFPAVHKKFRKALVRRFPFGIFYVIKREVVFVIAIYHASRDPERWRERQ
ncbi:MAG: type II toxin-antitoxin system RelE/ParE family toxin [Planctomycetota bacterium]|nr:type II toxin-antitoxin system RelE/ParE family toxin [Planctomycetota bacterium]